MGAGFDLAQMKDEIQVYTDILLGRNPPPIDAGVLTLAEVANAFYCRAKEMEMSLLNGEAEGAILKGSGPYKFRTGALRAFVELSGKAYELGSRRLSDEQMKVQMGG